MHSALQNARYNYMMINYIDDIIKFHVKTISSSFLISLFLWSICVDFDKSLEMNPYV